ncbi:helix-turn-helix transcriptional regulator [Enterococcus cecorum]|uniref:helix-turn-helix domain-containing protein n=2 Tax=Enterococcus cecorum TaxID=44008 RepID=UPI0006434E43|nr:helix-turn-helix transcriptional regulator [Enterococcus cecorum]KLO71299.1 DNA-binding protein [Enterococcus cecorum]MCJ0522239.1 helix-turn-helix transcriptional regulator [Enterococcus cecorum]MCJ0554056.1 helix-turn-helix transcriptional regulator [Enterococcus cecorum]MCJ0557771.1 helix-turn-helix transcriptional regulator [Enterococcus cecorum]MCJ0560711.1 helix-turn-helix transcriptional regulator [Enterococcus cecorum]
MWKKIEQEIKKQGLTQYKLSKMIGVSPSVLTDLKNGRNKKPSFELMEKIADALNVSMDVFRKDDEDDGNSDV